MNLLTKVATAVSICFVALITVITLLFNTLLLGKFVELENEQANRNVTRVTEALQGEVNSLIARTHDWAVWDDSYNFVNEQYESFIKSNLTYEALKTLDFSHIVFINNKLEIAYATEVDFEHEKAYPLSKSAKKTLVDTKAFEQVLKDGKANGGIVNINNKHYLAAASPIFDSAMENPQNGILIFTRELTTDRIDLLSQQISLPISASFIKPTKEYILKPTNNNFLDSISNPVFTINDSKINSKIGVLDIFGNESVKITLSTPRSLYKQGLAVRSFLAFSFCAVALITAALIILLLNKLIISPVSSIGSKLQFIAKNNNFAGRLESDRKDEIGTLATTINEALTALDTANNQTVKAQSIADQANRAKSIFIARVSHELRNPMGGVLGLNRLILKHEKSRAVGDLVKMSNQAAESCLSVINEILDFSKAESGELTFEKINFNVRDLVRNTMEVTAARLEAKEVDPKDKPVELICSIHPSVPTELIGDPLKLKQILINLLSNAIKFTAKGYIGLNVKYNNKAHSPSLILEVWDTGIGIARDKVDKVFTPYQQADESIARKYHGTGLGLSIVKQFVEGQNGDIELDSVEGSGSKFTISLPLNTAETNTYLKNTNIKPSFVTIVGNKDYLSESLLNDFKLHEIKSNICSVKDILSNNYFKDTDYYIFTPEAVCNIDCQKLLHDKDYFQNKQVALLIPPSEPDLKDELHKLIHLKIFSTPALVDDLINSYKSDKKNIEITDSGTSQVHAQARKALKVLIADDLPTNRLILEDLLTEAGHDVTAAADGQELLNKVRPMITGQANAEHFDIVITDITMPLLDGDAATRMIRQLENRNTNGHHIPILAVTGHAFTEERQRIEQAGVDGVLIKPVRPEDVAHAFLNIFPEDESYSKNNFEAASHEII